MANPRVDGAPEATPSEKGSPSRQLNMPPAARPMTAGAANPVMPRAATFNIILRFKTGPAAPSLNCPRSSLRHVWCIDALQAYLEYGQTDTAVFEFFVQSRFGQRPSFRFEEWRGHFPAVFCFVVGPSSPTERSAKPATSK